MNSQLPPSSPTHISEGQYTVPGLTTILSAYETHNGNELDIFKPRIRAGELFSVNEDITGLLTMDPEKHSLTFVSGIDSETRFILDTKQFFAAFYSKKTIRPKYLSLEQAIRSRIPLDKPKEDETCFTILSYQLKNSKSSLVAHSFKTTSVKITEEWVLYLQSYLKPHLFTADLTFKPRKFLFIINPYGGGKTAVKQFNELTKPMLNLADINYDLFETKHFQHGIELINKANDLTNYDAIISVGGDGVFHEIINGALTRSDWSEIIKIPFGLLPAGSGNGLSASFGFSDFAIASVNIIRRNTTKFDVGAIYTSNRNHVTYSILDGVTGYLSDLDDTADEYRWMGPFRLDFAGFIRALFLRKYRTRIYYIPEGEVLDSCVTSITPKQTNISVGQHQSNFPGPQPSIPNALKGTNVVTDPISDRLGNAWQMIDGAFSFVAATNVPNVSKDFCISNSATPSNGNLSLIYDSKNLSGFDFAGAVLNEVGNPGNGKFTSIMKEIKAQAIIIENLGLVISDKQASSNGKGGKAHTQVIGDRLITWNPIKPGSFRVDGESLLGSTSIQIQILPSLINFISPL